MSSIAYPADRRAFLRRAGGLGLGAVAASALAGCGGGVAGSAVAPPAPDAPVDAVQAPVLAVSSDMDTLNFALNLQYLAAQYYAFAATGAGLPLAMLTGAGVAGEARGGRLVAFANPLVAQHAAETAADKAAHVTALRSTLGALAVAQPAIDLTGGALATAAGLTADGRAFNPFAGDDAFLLGAFLFEETIAAAYRDLLPQLVGAQALQAAGGGLTLAVYHSGLIRAELADRGDADERVKASAARICATLSQLSGVGPAAPDTSAPLADPRGPDILDAELGAIPYRRSKTQVMAGLCGTTTVRMGGFYPSGFNGALCTPC